MRPWRGWLAGAWAIFVGASSCRTEKSQENPEVVVFAASSLRESVEQLARTFEARHPGARLVLNFAGSQELRAQLEQGARADLFLSADERNMMALEEQGLVQPSRALVCNGLAVVIPSDAPADMDSFDDLPRARRVVLATPEVPVGAYAERILDEAQGRYGEAFSREVRSHVVSRELNTRHVLSKVLLGEADAAMVYRTDAKVGGSRVRVLEVPADLQILALYPIALLQSSPSPKQAGAFLEHLTGAEGKRAFQAAGFIDCPGTAR